MSEIINGQSQPIPAYSGIVINITNPTLNAAPIQGCGNIPQNMNAVGINVSNPQVRQQNNPIKQENATTPDMISPNGYYSQAEVYQQKTKSDTIFSNSENRNTELNSTSDVNTELNTKTINNTNNHSSEKINQNENSIESNKTTNSQNNSNIKEISNINNNESSLNNNQKSVISETNANTVNDSTRSTYTEKEIIKETEKNSDNTDSNIQAKAYSSEANNIKSAEALSPVQDGNSAYPAPYYINNYYGDSKEKDENKTDNSPKINTADDMAPQRIDNIKQQNDANNLKEQNEDMSVSQEIISDIDNKRAEEIELEKNGTKTKIVALTNEYIMSLENYLNNPNLDIRLMASKEILTRLNEDRDRYDDAALNALLNKMLQDPAKLVRVAALSALASDLASGNDYTVQILNRIQQDPNSDKEDVLDAAQILLNMTASTETRYTPVRNIQKTEVEQQ